MAVHTAALLSVNIAPRKLDLSQKICVSKFGIRIETFEANCLALFSSKESKNASAGEFPRSASQLRLASLYAGRVPNYLPMISATYIPQK